MLRWQQRFGRLSLSTGREGSRTAVDWDPNSLLAHNYIGTLHSHPYRLRLGQGVGFSFGDFVFFAENFPRHFPVGVNFVVSCEQLYLAIYREVTRKDIADEEKVAMDVDENEAEDYLLRKLGGRNHFDREMLEVNIADQEGRITDSCEIERALYAEAPGYADRRVSANKRMMKTAADALQFELYYGKLGSTLHLKSHRVCR